MYLSECACHCKLHKQMEVMCSGQSTSQGHRVPFLFLSLLTSIPSSKEPERPHCSVTATPPSSSHSISKHPRFTEGISIGNYNPVLYQNYGCANNIKTMKFSELIGRWVAWTISWLISLNSKSLIIGLVWVYSRCFLSGI